MSLSNGLPESSLSSRAALPSKSSSLSLLNSLLVSKFRSVAMAALLISGCGPNGSFGADARDVLEWSDVDTGNTADTGNADDTDTGEDTGNSGDTGNDDTGLNDTGDDTDEPEDTGEPIEAEYTAQDCLEDAAGVSSRIWMDESNVAPSLNGSTLGVAFNETAGYGGELMAVLEMPNGDSCLNEQREVNVDANGMSVVSWDLSKPECGAYAVFTSGTVMNLTWYTVDGSDECDDRASSTEPLRINNDGSVSWL